MVSKILKTRSNFKSIVFPASPLHFIFLWGGRINFQRQIFFQHFWFIKFSCCLFFRLRFDRWVSAKFLVLFFIKYFLGATHFVGLCRQHGFAARLAGRCPAPASVILFCICSGLDGTSFNIFLLPSTSAILLGFGCWAGRNKFRPAASPQRYQQAHCILFFCGADK
jgi:hypothetical protein